MEAATQTKDCANCGKPTDAEIPEDLLGGQWEAFLRRLPLLCAACEAEDEAKEEAERQRHEALDAIQRLRDSGIPRDLQDLSFEDLDRGENPERARAIEDAQLWGMGELKGLVLSGPVGVGKTRIAATAANAYLKQRPLDWVTVPQLVTMARAGFKDPAREEMTRLLLAGNRALCLDDLDKTKPTEMVLDVLFQAINARVSNGAPLLVTTNLRYQEIEEMLGEPIASRLAQLNGHRIEGQDRRQK